MESRDFHGNRPPGLSENWNHEPKQGFAASLFLQGLHISAGCLLLSGVNQLSLSHFLKAQLGFPSFLPAESTVNAQQVRACFHCATLFCVSVSVCCDLSSSPVPFSVLLCPWGLTCMHSVGRATSPSRLRLLQPTVEPSKRQGRKRTELAGSGHLLSPSLARQGGIGSGVPLPTLKVTATFHQPLPQLWPSLGPCNRSLSLPAACGGGSAWSLSWRCSTIPVAFLSSLPHLLNSPFITLRLVTECTSALPSLSCWNSDETVRWRGRQPVSLPHLHSGSCWKCMKS